MHFGRIPAAPMCSGSGCMWQRALEDQRQRAARHPGNGMHGKCPSADVTATAGTGTHGGHDVLGLGLSCRRYSQLAAPVGAHHLLHW